MRILAISLALLIPSLSLADVPGDPPEFSDLELDVLCDVTAPTFVSIAMTIGINFDGSVTGIAVDRSELGRCDSSVRLDPIVFGTLQTGLHQLQWIDDTAVYGVPYRYQAIPLDDQGSDLPFWSSFDLVAPVDYATCGEPIVGHGLITSEFAPGVLEVCGGTCWDSFTVDAGDPILSPYLNTGVPVQVIGSIDCTLGNVEGCALAVTQVIEAPCPVVANETESWGAIKARF